MTIYGTFIFYITVILTACGLAKIAYTKQYRRYKAAIIFGIILLLSIVAGIRYDVGSDWFQYYSGPEKIGSGNIYRGYDKGSYEIGYIILCKIVYSLGLGGTTLLFVYGFLTYLFFFKTIDKYAEDISVPFTVFVYGCLYYLVSFNIMRQALAISIAMYAISFLDVDFWENKGKAQIKLQTKISHNIRFFIWGIIAFLFHQASIICLLALPICILMRKQNLIRWIALGVVVIVVVNFRMFTQLAIQFTGSTSFQWYFIGQVGEQGSWIKYILRYIPMLLFIWMAYDSLVKKSRIYDIYNLVLVGLIVNSLSVVTETEIERVCFPFLYFIVIMMGFAYKNCRKRIRLWGFSVGLSNGFVTFFKIIFSLFIVWTMWYIFFYSRSYHVVPYKTVLFR
ncbi:EpsG family protein [Agathobacter sp.]